MKNIFPLILLYVAVVCASCCKDDPATDPVTMPSVAVGNFYYSDKTYSETYDNTKTCIGIVFTVNADGKSGKIVSLDEGTNLSWDGPSPDGPFEVIATDEYNGAANMEKIKTFDNDFNYYPAFKWCAEKGAGWYLPAIYESRAIFDWWNGDKTENNAKLGTAGGTPVSDRKSIWTSTELSTSDGNTNFTWTCNFRYGGNMDHSAKYYQLNVRAVHAF